MNWQTVQFLLDLPAEFKLYLALPFLILLALIPILPRGKKTTPRRRKANRLKYQSRP